MNFFGHQKAESGSRFTRKKAWFRIRGLSYMDPNTSTVPVTVINKYGTGTADTP